MSRSAACLPAVLLLCLAAAELSAAQLAIARPEGDCLAPALTSLANGYNFFPRSYQLQSILTPSASSSGLETTIKFASDFSVTYYGTYKVVNNSRTGEMYLLYQCGTPNPQAANTEMDLPPGTKVFEVPLSSVAVTDSNAAAFLSELGLTDRVAFASKYSFNPCLQAINVCGGSAVSASNDSTSDWQELSAAQQTKVDAIFTGDKAANPKSIAVTAYADPGVLNRAEWVKFVAVFFNKEVEANNLFNTITTTYKQLNTSARAAAAAAAGGPARVAWINKFGDSLTLSYAVYKQELVTDAGGQMPAVADVLAAGGVARTSGGNTNYNFNASVPAQRTGFLDILKEVDIIFDDSYTVAASNLLDMSQFIQAYGPGSEALPAVEAGKVFVFNNRLAKASDDTVSSDWFETATARPDQVLADFVKVITPTAQVASKANSPSWLRQLPTGVSASNGLVFTSAANCPAISTAANGADRCERTEPARICPNAYRDCATGELKTVTDPTQRCIVRTTCAEPAPASGAQQRPAGNAAVSVHTPGVLLQGLFAFLALAVAVLVL